MEKFLKSIYRKEVRLLLSPSRDTVDNKINCKGKKVKNTASDFAVYTGGSDLRFMAYCAFIKFSYGMGSRKN